METNRNMNGKLNTRSNIRPKKSARNKKKLWIGLAIVFVLIIAVVLTTVFIFGGKKKEKSEGNEEKVQQFDWSDRFADLENEPVSDMDVVYKDKETSSEKPYLIQVNKSQNIITIYKKDSKGKYTDPFKAMICSVGYDTPVGEFTTSDKYEWKIVNGNVWAQYATRVVGNVLFHSMPYTANSKDTLIPTYYNQLGSMLSASCIRTSAKDAEWIMKNCPAGTKVQIYESNNEEPLAKPKSIVVPEDAVWDPTDTDPANPYQSVQIAFDGINSKKTVERGTQINYMEGVKIKDTCGNDLSSEVTVTTNLNAFALGSYEVKYSVEDAAGKTAEAVTTYEIVDTSAPQFSGLKTTMHFTAIAEVTQENILKGVSVIDNNEILDNSRIVLVIPTIVEGSNTITISVTDDYNNITTTTIIASVHVKPPVISLKPGMETIIPLTQKVDQSYALSRVIATDDGVAMAADRIKVSITPMEWGYAFRYTATDENGYSGILNDSVTYVEYTITPPKKLVVTDIEDKNQLLKGVELNNNLGGSLEVSSIEISTKPVSDNQYQVTYKYTYESPLGKKTATANTMVTLEGVTTTETPKPTQEPEETQEPELSASPEVSATPDVSEQPDDAVTETPTSQP